MTLKHYRQELRYLLALGMPIMLTQLAQSSMGFVDTLIAGQHSTHALAAVALGSSIWLPLYLTAAGVLMATTPLVAYAQGDDRSHRVYSTVLHGLLIALVLGIGCVVFLYNSRWILDWMGVEATLASSTMDYLRAIAWGFPPLMLYQLLRSYFEGLGRTRPAMYIAIIGLLANIPLNYLLVFGKLGLPALGAAGCGWASALVMLLMLICGGLFIRYNPQLKLPAGSHATVRWSRQALTDYLRLGIPIGFSILIESSMFSVIALLLAPLGTLVVASHQITMTFTGLLFMIPLSLSMACTIRTGQLAGAGLYPRAWLSVRTALLLTSAIALSVSLIIWGFAEKIAGLFTQDLQLIEMACALLLIAALFEVSDAIQVTAAGALRGYKDTQIPLFIVFIAYWVIGLPLGYVLGLTDLLMPAMGAAGFWYGLVIGLTVSAIFLLARLTRVAKQT